MNKKDYFREYRIKHWEKIKAQGLLASRRHYLKNREKLAKEYLEKRSTKEYKDKRNEQRKRYMAKWKEAVYSVLGDKCIRCGFSDKRALQIDHINGDGFLENKKKNCTHYKKVIESVKRNEKRYQILCANCNWIKRYEKNEWAYNFRTKEVKIDDNKKCSDYKEASLFPLQTISSTIH